VRKRKGEGIFGEVGRGEWVGRGGAGGRPIWGGRFGWGTRGFLFVIGCGDFLFLIMVSVWVWLLGFGRCRVPVWYVVFTADVGFFAVGLCRFTHVISTFPLPL